MEMKVSHVKNPLSIIAIFAGIAEVSGTVVLPLVEPATQTVFVWFLMTFPFFLVSLFFLVLVFKHHVLYAPSDYKNEDNFMDHSRPAKAKEVHEKRVQEIRQAQEQSANDESPANPEGIDTSSESPPNSNYISAKQYQIVESWALEKFQQDLNITISKNVRVSGNSDYIFDGIGWTNKNSYVFEIKLVQKNTRDEIVETWSSELSQAISQFKNSDRGVKLHVAFVSLDPDLSERRQDEILRLFKSYLGGVDLTVAFFSISDFVLETGIHLQ